MEQLPSRKDKMLGRIVVERRMATLELIEECYLLQQLAGTNPNETAGAKGGRPLLAVLLEKGIIQESQVSGLLDELNSRLANLSGYESVAPSEMVLGQLLVMHNKATQNQVNKCLDIQYKLAQQGRSPVPRLGELLVEHGFVDVKTVQEILKLQHKTMLVCTNCGKQFNVIGLEEGKAYKCKVCDGLMMTRAQLDSLRADETTFGFQLPTADGPPPAPK